MTDREHVFISGPLATMADAIQSAVAEPIVEPKPAEDKK